MHRFNFVPRPDTIPFGDGEVFDLGGGVTVEAIHTPGHTPGGISLHADGCVFVGDTLFQGSIGRTDFPGGDFDTLLTSIRTRLFALDDGTTVYTGHGPETSIGTEKQFNPFARMA